VCNAIATERLDLVSFTLDFIHASLRGDRPLAESLIRLRLPDEWPGTVADVMLLRLRQLEVNPSEQPWLLRAIGLRSTGTMIGHVGFHTGPGAEYLRELAPGAVEIGYTIYAPYRRNGYAREAAIALMNWAHTNHGITCFIASISPENAPSQNLAAQLGFIRFSSHIDEVDGYEDILARRL
jgi:ribosomal-protein-alanine N-acetyltransferase